MRIAYFDCFAGISGDMTLGALVDAGADFDQLSEILQGLPIEPFEITREEQDVLGMRAVRVHVHAPEASVIRTYASIRSTLDAADLPDDARHTAHRIFRRLAEAEAEVHQKDVDLVTFHEIGALDSIVDIVGVAVALSQLGVERSFSSPVPTGFGMQRTDHGLTPIPSPAVVQLLRGAPMYSRGVPVELVTPTGAAILAAVAEGFGDMPSLRIDAVGYGAGTHRLDFPDVLRIIIGEEAPASRPHAIPDEGTDVLVETNIDDLTPELHAYVLERLLASGVQDAWLTPIVMKKGRPALTVSVLCSPDQEDAVKDLLFRETGTLGVRTYRVTKEALDRETLKVETQHGPVAVKVGRREGRVVSVAPEFEDCARVAGEAGVPAKDVFAEATRLARSSLGL